MLDKIQVHSQRRRAGIRASGVTRAIYTDQRAHVRVGVRVAKVRKGNSRSGQKLTLVQGKEITLSYGTAHTKHVTGMC